MVQLSRQMNRRIGEAMHDYNMLADGDRVLIAVSGGVDSLALTWILHHWQAKAPIRYELEALHLDMGFDDTSANLVEEQLQQLPVPYRIQKTTIGKDALLAEDGKSGCFHCSKKRRNLLFEEARQKNFTKIAFGHHREDIIETFFLNMLYSGNMSTMVPRQDIFEGRLSIIRPLAYLEKQQIIALARALDISPVSNPCPIAGDSKREQVRTTLSTLYQQDDRIQANIFSALTNIKEEYLLIKKNTGQTPHRENNP